LTQADFGVNVKMNFMRVWLSRSEAEKIRQWAMSENEEALADRFYRVERAGSEGRTPFLVKRRGSRPLLLRCKHCQRWEEFARHRDAIEDGWVHLTGGWPLHGWVHGRCVEAWKVEGVELSKLRASAEKHRSQLDFLFGQPTLLDNYKDVLVRFSHLSEQTSYANLVAETGDERVRKVIDEMPDTLRTRLVGAAFVGAAFVGAGQRYDILLGWVESIPPEYDNAEVGDVHCESVLVFELSRSLRRMLPERLRDLL
jgi:hypothetical protein